MTSRKDFEAVAKAIQAAQPFIGDGERELSQKVRRATCQGIAVRCADYFAADNPRFDRDKFFQVCGL